MQAGGGPPDPAQFRQRMMDRLKEQLGATDDEFKVIQPKLEKVMTSRGGGMMGGMGRGRGPGGGGDQPSDNPVIKAMQDLRTTLDNKEAKADDIAGKLKALRDARDKQREDNQKAQKDLKEVLTQRQEAVLVMWGMLD